jgi:Domain of unknown function (DUF4383)
MNTPKKNLNYYTLLIFAPVLILTGLLGFILPDGLMSNAPSYNIFHIIFGLIGLAFVLSGKENIIRAFNIGFGLIDLYQALASLMDWFPESWFQWKTADDVLHIVIGAALIFIGLISIKKIRA